MALASILFTDGSFKKVELDKAIKAYEALTGITEPTEAQAEWLCTIQRIFLPPSVRPAGYTPVYPSKSQTAVAAPQETPDDPDRLHSGITQGSYQGLPVNDR